MVIPSLVTDGNSVPDTHVGGLSRACQQLSDSQSTLYTC